MFLWSVYVVVHLWSCDTFIDLYCGSIASSVDVTPLSPFLNRMPLGVGTQFVFDK